MTPSRKTSGQNTQHLRSAFDFASHNWDVSDSPNGDATLRELRPRRGGLRRARALYRSNHLGLALSQVRQLRWMRPAGYSAMKLEAAILLKLTRVEQAVEIYRHLLAHFPPRVNTAIAYGHALKTGGDIDAAVAAYRLALSLDPQRTEVWWSLANLKTYRFSTLDIEKLQALLADIHEQSPQPSEPLANLHFTLGKALEDQREFDLSFHHYRVGNEYVRRRVGYNPLRNRRTVEKMIAHCDSEVTARTADGRCPAVTPIFIVGLPRSGSTLLEQILATHSQVEATAELPDILSLARGISATAKANGDTDYPASLRCLSRARLSEIGSQYLQKTELYRNGAPFFIDKMPNNFLHLGLIGKILPQAKIIDMRRAPMAACFGAYKQMFARGQSFSYSLSDLGAYYCDYVRLMQHWHQVLPDRILAMEYEALVTDTEGQVRRLLSYVGLPFEQRCLQFYQTQRAVMSASAGQVRRPIYTDSLQQWCHYESHLDQLTRALQPILSSADTDTDL